jgi:hypothetical protein
MRPYPSTLLMLFRRSNYGGKKALRANVRLRDLDLEQIKCECKEAADGEHECPMFDLLEQIRAKKQITIH